MCRYIHNTLNSCFKIANYTRLIITKCYIKALSANRIKQLASSSVNYAPCKIETAASSNHKYSIIHACHSSVSKMHEVPMSHHRPALIGVISFNISVFEGNIDQILFDVSCVKGHTNCVLEIFVIVRGVIDLRPVLRATLPV